jgi:hypothetical protein
MAPKTALQTVAKKNLLSLPGLKFSRPPLSLMTALTKHLGNMGTIYNVTCILGMYMMSIYFNSLCHC